MLKILFLSTVGLPVFALLVVLSVAVIVSVVYNLFFKNRYKFLEALIRCIALSKPFIYIKIVK